MTQSSDFALVELDLSGAEWQVVAFVSNDPNMIEVVRSGKDPHVVTGSLISNAPEDVVVREDKVVDKASEPDLVSRLRADMTELEDIPNLFLPRAMSIRQAGKKSNHGLNYNMGYRRFALENEMQEGESKTIVEHVSQQSLPQAS